MRDYVRRLLIAGLIAICVSLLFLGGKSPKAEGIITHTEHWIWPAEGEITDTFGTRKGMHHGIDIAAALNTPIYAVDVGVVSKSYYSDTYGNVVFIKHPNNYETVYAHLHKRNVKEGEIVRQGTLIGKMGNTGDSSGVHLHFEVHENEWTYSKENVINPDYVLGLTEIGQAVVAFLRANPGGSIETSGQAKERKSKIEAKHYIVAEGDTLTSISRKTGISVVDIKNKNQLESNVIYPEQVLVIE